MNVRKLLSLVAVIVSLLAIGTSSAEAFALRRAQCIAPCYRPVPQVKVCKPVAKAEPCTIVCRPQPRSLWNLGKQMGAWPSLP